MNVRKIKRMFRTNSSSPIMPEASARVRRILPEASEEEVTQILLSKPTTMTSEERLWSLLKAVKYVEGNNIEGDFVESGVWKGGSSRLMAQVLMDSFGPTRDLWLFDTFEGVPAPGEKDVRSNGKTARELLEQDNRERETSLYWGFAAEEPVKGNLLETGYPIDKLHFIKGDVRETLPKWAPEKIAICRLDTSWYESTKVELETLMPRMTPGGVVIVNAYGDWSGVKMAIDEYFNARDWTPLLHRVDYTGRTWIAP